MDQNNVISLNKHRYAIFNPQVRNQLEANIKPYTEQPQQTIDTIESTLCTILVSAVRRIASDWGKRLGESITDQADKAFNE